MWIVLIISPILYTSRTEISENAEHLRLPAQPNQWQKHLLLERAPKGQGEWDPVHCPLFLPRLVRTTPLSFAHCFIFQCDILQSLLFHELETLNYSTPLTLPCLFYPSWTLDTSELSQTLLTQMPGAWAHAFLIMFQVLQVLGLNFENYHLMGKPLQPGLFPCCATQSSFVFCLHIIYHCKRTRIHSAHQMRPGTK